MTGLRSASFPGGVEAVETTDGILYRIRLSETNGWIEFTASVDYGYKVEIPDGLAETHERELQDGRWIYGLALDPALLDTEETPYTIGLKAVEDLVLITITGDGIVTGVDETGMAQLGSPVSIEVTTPGYTLNLRTEDENGVSIYTAMELDYDNRYSFTVEEPMEFDISDPEQAEYRALFAESRKAKITGVAGLKLNGLASSAQGYDEIVLNFTAVQNGSDGDESGKVYYEVGVKAVPGEGEKLPAGSSVTAQYYYVPKTENVNTQSRSIKVNSGKLSEPTACTYEFSVRMVQIARTVSVPKEDKSVSSPLTTVYAGNTITKSFATKNLYYEDKIGFNKKNTKMFTGQQNVLAGSIKYSKNASYIHDVTAVAYDSRGIVCDGIECTFRNDNDELYVSASDYIKPGKYKIVVYAGIGETETTADSPQSGTMYQSNTSFTMTLQPGINWIDTSRITDRVVLSSKNVSFSAVPVGYCEYDDYYDYGSQKAKSQKFTYEIKSVSPSNWKILEPTEEVKNCITVSKNGKVTVKKEYTVGTANNYTDYVAVVIKAADYEGNETTSTKIVAIKGNAQVPTKMYLVNQNGYRMNGDTFDANVVDGARVVVEDQGGQNMNEFVTITPSYSANAKIYVSQYSDSASLYVRKCGKVTIKATSKDGKKKTLTLKLNVTEPTNFYTMWGSVNSITSDGFPVSNKWQGNSGNSGNYTYSAPLKGAVINFRTWPDISNTYSTDNWFNWKFKASGGTAKCNGNSWTLKPTSKTMELVMWQQSNPKRTWTWKFTNDRWGENYESAPKIKLVSGKIYSNRYTSEDEVQTYTYDGGDGEIYTERSIPSQTVVYSYSHLSVRDIRCSSVTKGAPYPSVRLNAEERTISLTFSAGNDLKPGSYKYKFAFYDEYGYLYCKPVTITVKINKSSPVKIASSYTINNSQNGENSVRLKCTPGEFLPDFDASLMNANVAGKANDFNKYFELAYVTDPDTKTKSAVIRFKSSVSAEEKAALKGKSISGYVRYNYYYGYDYVRNATSKVTIKIK